MSHSHSPSHTISSPSPSPPTFPLTRYESRNKNGIYDHVTDRILKLGNKTLAGTDYQEHFVREVTEKGHFKYVATEQTSREDCHFLLFGETCAASKGTQMSSRGNKTNYEVSAL